MVIMSKTFVQLLAIMMALFSAMDSVCQNTTNVDTIEMKDFSNEFILNGKQGKIFNINTKDKGNSVVVRWNNGFFAIGTTFKGKPFGKWFLYDRKNRHRESLIFGPHAECILYSKKMNKKGKIISEFKSITPCF
jgi:hypothetical protein